MKLNQTRFRSSEDPLLLALVYDSEAKAQSRNKIKAISSRGRSDKIKSCKFNSDLKSGFFVFARRKFPFAKAKMHKN